MMFSYLSILESRENQEQDQVAANRNTREGNTTNQLRDLGIVSRRNLHDASREKRKYEPESLAAMKLSATDDVSQSAPDLKRERSSYFDLGGDTDSPSAYPKHVMVLSNDRGVSIDNRYAPTLGRNDDDPIPHPLLPIMLATHGSFSPPEQKGMSYGPGHNNSTVAHHHGAQLLTPDSIGNRQQSQSYDSHHQPHYSGSSGKITHHQSPFHDVYRTASYNPDMDYGGNSVGKYGHGNQGNSESFSRTRRWACDFCNVATFLSYEEACAHEETCSARHLNNVVRYNESSSQHFSPHHDQRIRNHHSSSSRNHQSVTSSPYGPTNTDLSMTIVSQVPSQGGVNLGTIYHGTQEVVTPPTPHHSQTGHRWGAGGSSLHISTPHGAPPLPVFPHEQGYYRGGSSESYYDSRSVDEPSLYPLEHHSASYHNTPTMTPHQQPYHHPYNHTPSYHHQSPNASYYSHDTSHGRLVLAMPTDRDSLSDRQCYVRGEMVEIFAATEKDVAARHSKGAQRLVLGQVGIRCIHCRHLRPRDRAERAVCYPSSISRIYQTVADMQRFHFEQCREIPDHVRQIYKKLKTTRPRGVGSPQTYWISSAKKLGLEDTGDGIRFDTDPTPPVPALPDKSKSSSGSGSNVAASSTSLKATTTEESTSAA
jgi:hypothetical protein